MQHKPLLEESVSAACLLPAMPRNDHKKKALNSQLWSRRPANPRAAARPWRPGWPRWGEGPGQRDPTLGTAFLGDGERRQDTHFNFVGGVYDRNENWSQPAPGTRTDEGSSQSENMTNPSDNLLLLMQRQMVQGRLRDAAQSLKGDQVCLGAGVRSPPEGAEVGGPGDEKAATEDTAKECRKPLSSPAEDNGHGASALRGGSSGCCPFLRVIPATESLHPEPALVSRLAPGPAPCNALRVQRYGVDALQEEERGLA
nr:PREDICTED: UPF0500 protein C1orf216 homolog [Struthio camelus australis]